MLKILFSHTKQDGAQGLLSKTSPTVRYTHEITLSVIIGELGQKKHSGENTDGNFSGLVKDLTNCGYSGR